MSKTADKLARLAGFGLSAGAEPAAAAREALKTPLEAPQIAPDTPPPSPPSSIPSESPERANLTRNVVFLPADQDELDRIEDTLRIAGIRKPTIADLVRVALRAAKPTPEEAAVIFKTAKALDARRKPC